MTTKNNFTKFNKHIEEVQSMLDILSIKSDGIAIQSFSTMSDLIESQIVFEPFHKALGFHLFKDVLGGWQMASIDHTLFLIKKTKTKVLYIEAGLKQ